MDSSIINGAAPAAANTAPGPSALPDVFPGPGAATPALPALGDLLFGGLPGPGGAAISVTTVPAVGPPPKCTITT